MEKLFDVIEGFNLLTILSIVWIIWYFTRDIIKEIRLLEAKIDKQAARTDRLYEMFIDLLKERK